VFREREARLGVVGEYHEDAGAVADHGGDPVECVAATEQGEVPGPLVEDGRLPPEAPIERLGDAVQVLFAAFCTTHAVDGFEGAAPLRGLQEQRDRERRVVEVPAQFLALEEVVDVD